ncbi:MAG TPA: EAL domain-containing protein, partial [Tepidisphaeraceae bacterium]|nr:EAL domain-containing protein [Tepidisphaeraceae bacterium]
DPEWSAYSELLGEYRLATRWSLPILLQCEELGTISIFAGADHFPTTEDIELLKSVANKAAIAIEHQDLIDRLAHQSLHDNLTSLPNQMLVDDRLQHAIARAQRAAMHVGLFQINIDRFRMINETQGRGIGDELLRQIAARLLRNVRASDTVGRIGADEFVVITGDLKTREAANILAEKLNKILGQPYTVAGREVSATASIGAAVYPEDGSDPATLRHASELALEKAKHQGRNSHALFQADMSERLAERSAADIYTHLRRAVENHELSLHYQPQVNAAGNIVAVEALLRWDSPMLGRVSPAKFIPVAEQSSLIIPIGEWVLREASGVAKRLNCRPDMASLRMAVNVSALQFSQPHFVHTVQDVLRETGLPPRLLELELTESLLMKNTQDASAKLTTLRKIGVAAAIDDFGTGYSSLAYLRRLPIDTLKIDRSFVCDIDPAVADDSSTAVIRAILSMAKSLGLNVVAEGVETTSQRDFLIRNECGLMQGYLFGMPQPADEIEKLLDSNRNPMLALSA